MDQPVENELRFLPDYQYFTVRDGSSYDRPGGKEVLRAAREAVAAATPWEVYVVCAQDLAQVHVVVRPGPDVDGPGPTWLGPSVFRISFPTGEARIGDVTGRAISVPLAAGPGDYLVSLFTRGREEARQRIADLPRDEFVHSPGGTSLLHAVHGVEQYYIVFAPAEKWTT